jgi:beta-glucoside operon transcriptional antiterminator
VRGYDRLKIKRIFNNNALLADKNGREVVLFGNGIGFQKKRNDEVDETKIERLFTPSDNEWFTQFQELIGSIPANYFELSVKIVEMAEKMLNQQFKEYVLIAITDHIHFAVIRHQKHMNIKNEILWEIQRIYQQEYQVGLEALKLIKQETGVELPEDEAGFVAMKFVENTKDQIINRANESTELINNILNIVQYQLNNTFNVKSMSYQRFIAHLRFFAERLYKSNEAEGNSDIDVNLLTNVSLKYERAFRCAKQVQIFVQEQTSKIVSANELAYLTIHIQRILTEQV